MALGVHSRILPPAAHLGHLLIEPGRRREQRGLGLLTVAAIEMPAQAVGNIAAFADKRPHPFIKLVAEYRAKQLDAVIFGLHSLGVGTKALIVPGRAIIRRARA